MKGEYEEVTRGQYLIHSLGNVLKVNERGTGISLEESCVVEEWVDDEKASEECFIEESFN